MRRLALLGLLAWLGCDSTDYPVRDAAVDVRDSRIDARDGAGDADGDTPADAPSDAADARPARGAPSPWPLAFTAEQVVRAAVLFGTCVPDDGAYALLDDAYYDPSLDFFEVTRADAIGCLAESTDGCAAIARCTGLEFDLTGPCTRRCDGDTFDGCDDAWHFRVPCGMAGLVCDPDQGCVDPTAAMCDDEAFDETCREGHAERCNDDRVRGEYVCEELGLACSVTAERADCRGTLGECTATSRGRLDIVAMSCVDGDTLEGCVNGGVHRLACGTIAEGFTCQSMGGEEFCGLGDACDPRILDGEDGTATCDGDTIVICNAGRLDRVDCTSLGFTGCAVGGRDGAYCTPSAWIG